MPKSRVAILRTTPRTVPADYHRLMNLAGHQEVIDKSAVVEAHQLRNVHPYEGDEEWIPVREAPEMAACRRRRRPATANEGGPE